MPYGVYAEMPPFTPEELAAKSAPELLDEPYLEAGTTAADRLLFTPERWAEMLATDGYITVPLDAKSEVNLPARGRKMSVITVENPMTEADAAHWREEMGYDVDQLNRPINPRADQVATTPGFGMLTGMGKYWKVGPNFIGNAGLRIQRFGRVKYLMTCSDRGKGDVWGVPGGHTEDGDLGNVEYTALRETQEETGVKRALIEKLKSLGLLSHFIHRDWPQANRGATMNAWQEGEFHLYAAKRRRTSRTLGRLTLEASDLEEGISKIAWVQLKDIRSGVVNVMGSHKEAIEAHEVYLKQQRTQRLRQKLSSWTLAA